MKKWISALTLVLLLSLIMPLGAIQVEAAPPGVGEPDPELLEGIEDIWIYDENGNPLKVSIEDVGENCGEICICVACAYRATQVAISELWDLEEEYPHQGDFEITSAHPSSGHQCTFEYITGVVPGETYIVEMPEGTSAMNLTLENYTYTFTRTDTEEEEFTIQVREGIFPDGFFELRAKVKSGEATEEEIALFAEQWEEVRDKFLTLEPWELFDIEEPGEEAAPVWSLVFALGLTVLVIGTIVYQAVRVRR